MNNAATLTRRPTFHRLPATVLIGGLGLVALGAGVAANLYLGAGPQPLTVTDAQGAATFNFRVTGIPVPGQLGGVKPDLTFSPHNLSATRGTITVDLKTLNTGIALRDEHARNFLGVKTHPQAVFALDNLEGVSALRPGETQEATVSGTLDLNGVSVPLNAPATLAYLADGSAITVKTRFNVTFKDHKIAIPGADPRTDVKVEFRLPIGK